MLKAALIISILLITGIIIVLAATGFFSESNEEEYNINTCADESCIRALCGECHYIENTTCFRHECCNNSECAANESCQNHSCQELSCESCQYQENQLCYNYVCCSDSDCADENSSTIDKCREASTITSYCEHLDYECLVNADCEDHNLSTKDVCTISTKKCSNVLITNCGDEDDYCPEGCNHTTDDDCEQADECNSSADCDDEDNSTNDYCMGSPKVCNNTLITDCIDDDGYCPGGCNYTNDDNCNPAGDLFLQNINWLNTTPYTIVVEIRKNNSNMEAGYPLLKWNLYIDGEEITSVGTDYDVSMGGVDIFASENDSGSHNVRIVIDPDNDILETNEDNNDVTQTINIL